MPGASDPPRRARLLLPLALFAASLAILGGVAIFTLSPAAQQTTGGIGGPFTLTAQDGRRVSERDFFGAPHLVFFGFTHCPDVCPTKLFELSEVLRAAGPKAKDVKALFVSIDPERDTPEVLKNYLASFDDRIIGLTGPPADVAAAVKAFRAYSRKVPLKDGDYTMEHTALVYLMDARGRFVSAFNLDRPPQEAARDLLRHL